jgi:hypothetical protein
MVTGDHELTGLTGLDRRPIGIKQSAAAPLELPAVKPVSAPFRIVGACDASHLLPPQDCTDPGEQFIPAEWFDQVVIPARIQAADPVFDPAALSLTQALNAAPQKALADQHWEAARAA